MADNEQLLLVDPSSASHGAEGMMGDDTWKNEEERYYWKTVIIFLLIEGMKLESWETAQNNSLRYLFRLLGQLKIAGKAGAGQRVYKTQIEVQKTLTGCSQCPATMTTYR